MLSDIKDSNTNIMTPKKILERCRYYNLFETPSLNEVLYLHMCGFSRIGNLSEYYNIKTLWLQDNLIRKIERLDTCPHITCLCDYSSFFIWFLILLQIPAKQPDIKDRKFKCTKKSWYFRLIWKYDFRSGGVICVQTSFHPQTLQQ